MSRSNDVPSDVGQHCSLLDCKTLDFLPFTCPHCARVHCREHAAPDLHACEKASSSDNIAQDGGSRFTDKFNDLLPDAKRRALDRDGVERNKQQKRLDAREVLARNFGQAAVARLDRTTNSIPSTPIKAQGKAPSPVIMLMKLKQRAIPVDAKAKSLSIEDRLYLSVQHRCGVEHELKSERAVWISKMCTVGRALDQLASFFKLNNLNNTSTDPAQLLALSKPDTVPLVTSASIASLVDNGDTLWLLQGAIPGPI